MADATPTAEVIASWKAGRAKLKANPTIIDASIAKLSPAAQVPAKKFRDLMLSDEEDPAKFHAVGAAIKEEITEAMKTEMETHKAEAYKILGILA